MVETAIPEEEWEKWEEKVTVLSKEAFPYLDMKMYWDNKDLWFVVYNKENQRIKYVHRESCYHASVFKAIPEGVFMRLGRLTSKTRENENVPITELCLDHREALRVAKILPKKKKIPTVKKLYKMELEHSKPIETMEADEYKQDTRKLYFAIGHSCFWKKMRIAQIILQLKKKFKLKFL
eukprot:15355193-Ditylum_brightwellii.AAC.1